jgi:hypothetical protein
MAKCCAWFCSITIIVSAIIIGAVLIGVSFKDVEY